MVSPLPSNWASALVNPQAILRLLVYLHGKALSGLPGQASAAELAARFAQGDGRLDERIDSLIKAEIIRAASLGFLTGLGGMLTLPLSIPGNLAANFFLQLRMSSAIATLCGLAPDTPAVRSLAMVCLTGDDARAMLEKIGIQFFMLPRDEAMAKITQAVGTQLTDAVGRRVLAKIGEKGTARLGRGIPLFGGVVSAGVDALFTRDVGRSARAIFLHVSAG